MNSFWDEIYFGNSVKDWAIALGIILVAFFLLYIIKNILLARLKKWASKTETNIDDFIISGIQSSVIPLSYVLIVYAAIQYLEIPAKVLSKISILIWVVVLFFVLRILTAGIKYFIFGVLRKKEVSKARQKQANGLILILNIFIWVIGFIFFLGNLGYNVTTLIAGLGIGGVAIALAAQAILADLFSYFVIFFDKPFEIGDYVTVDDQAGTVEYIGLKTTRIRTLTGDQLICSNKDMTDSRVHNFGSLSKRRILFKIGLVSQLSTNQLKRVPDIIKNIIDKQADIQFDRAHFIGFGKSSFDFEIVYYVTTPDFTVYMNRQQSIWLEMLDVFEKENISLAHPTQTLFFKKDQQEKDSNEKK